MFNHIIMTVFALGFCNICIYKVWKKCKQMRLKKEEQRSSIDIGANSKKQIGAAIVDQENMRIQPPLMESPVNSNNPPIISLIRQDSCFVGIGAPKAISSLSDGNQSPMSLSELEISLDQHKISKIQMVGLSQSPQIKSACIERND